MAININHQTNDISTTGGSLTVNGQGLGGGATGGGTNKIFWENDQTVTTNYTITTGKNAGSFGPITIADGVAVTIPNGSTWTLV